MIYIGLTPDILATERLECFCNLEDAGIQIQNRLNAWILRKFDFNISRH